MNILAEWYRAECSAIAQETGTPRGGLMLGGIVFGQPYLDIFAKYSLPSILSPSNRKAILGNAEFVIYTDEASRQVLEQIPTRGIEMTLRIIPEAIARNHAIFWPRMAVMQALLLRLAAQRDMAFHVLLADQVYSQVFFPNLLRLGASGRNVLNNGMNAMWEAHADLEVYRQPDGSLAIPARILNDIAWAHLHWRMNCFVMKADDFPDRFYNTHYQLWRARDRVLMFGPHNSLEYLQPDTCKLILDDKDVPSGTLDTQVQRLAGTNFVVPQFDDEVTLIGLEHTGPPREPIKNYADSSHEFIEWCWAGIQGRDDFLVYFSQPTAVLPMSSDESAPSVEEVMGYQGRIVDMLVTHKAK